MRLRTVAAVRARRFPLRLRLKYRAMGEKRWHRGITENLSCSGILIRCRCLLPRAASVEIMLPVPRQLAGDAHFHVLCHGRIVRVDRGQHRPSTALGIKVLDYELIDAQSPGATPPAGCLAALAHDLNNMLSVIVGGGELIAADADAGVGAKRHAETIIQAALRAAALVRELNPKRVSNGR